MTALVPVLVLTVITVLFVAWSLGQALIRIEDHRSEAEDHPQPQPAPVLPPSRHVPDVERHIDWVLPPDDEFEAHLAALTEEYAATIRAFRWATGELVRIREAVAA